MKKSQFIIMLAALAVSSVSFGDIVQVNATRDTGIIDSVPGNNLGVHTHSPAGQANNGFVFRSLFYFDLGSFVPSGVTINSVSFEFDVTRQGGPLGQQGADFDLHRIATDWAEGTGFGNLGSISNDGADLE